MLCGFINFESCLGVFLFFLVISVAVHFSSLKTSGGSTFIAETYWAFL